MLRRLTSVFIGNYTQLLCGVFMADEIKIDGVDKTRRSAIKTAAQVAVTAPAVAMLLSASTKAASAQRAYDGGTEEPSGDFFDDAGVLDDGAQPPA